MVKNDDNKTNALSSASSSPPPLIKAVLFDVDGTLVNSDPIHFAVFRELLLKEVDFNNNEPIDETFFRTKIAGRQNALIMKDLFPDWSLERREEWSIRKEARFRDLASSSLMERKMPGLDKLRTWIDENKLRKVAVTNAPRLNAEAMLSGIDYDNWFSSHVIIGDECDRPKPDPCPYLVACSSLDDNTIKPENCIVFEDSPSGARAGVAAGAANVIGILSGQTASTLIEIGGCGLTIKDFNDPKLWEYLNNNIRI